MRSRRNSHDKKYETIGLMKNPPNAFAMGSVLMAVNTAQVVVTIKPARKTTRQSNKPRNSGIFNPLNGNRMIAAIAKRAQATQNCEKPSSDNSLLPVSLMMMTKVDRNIKKNAWIRVLAIGYFGRLFRNCLRLVALCTKSLRPFLPMRWLICSTARQAAP